MQAAGGCRSLPLSLLVLDTTGSGTAAGLVPLIQYLPVLLLAPWAGAVLVGRDSHRRGRARRCGRRSARTPPR